MESAPPIAAGRGPGAQRRLTGGSLNRSLSVGGIEDGGLDRREEEEEEEEGLAGMMPEMAA